MSAAQRLQGRLLVATPRLTDPNFRRTVIYMIDHRAEGAAGVVVNRPSEMAVSEVVPAWEEAAVPPRRVFFGGPVAPGGLVALAPDVAPLSDGMSIGVVDLGRPSSSSAGRIRVFAGHAGWGSGQLESELEGGSWFVVDAMLDDVVDEQPDRLWERVLRRQGGFFTNATDKPSMN
ncbi:MAG: YqgE/AlgH family protein [Egibacteraceae bacterium]